MKLSWWLKEKLYCRQDICVLTVLCLFGTMQGQRGVRLSFIVRTNLFCINFKFESHKLFEPDR